MNVAIHRSRNMPAKHNPSIEEKKLKQEPFTTEVGKGSAGQNSIQKNLAEMQKQIDAFYRIAIATAKQPSLDEKNQGDHATQMIQLMSASTTAQASKITTQAPEIQEAEAKTAQAQMIGKSVKVVSTRTFSATPGERVTFKYDVANIPKDATISGTVTILDANKRKVRTEKIKYMNAGDNKYVWDGLTDSGKIASEGQYTIQVKATYKAPGSKDITPAIVNTMIESKITEVDIEPGQVTLADGTKVGFSDVVKYYDEEAAKKNKKSDMPPDISRAKDFIHKNINTKEDKVNFEGLRSTKLGFHSPDKVKVKAVITQGRETKPVQISEMNIKESRNSFSWSGEAVVTEDDLQAKANGANFDKLPNGKYEYALYVSKDGESWDRIDPRSTVYVEGTEHEEGVTMLALKGGGAVAESCFDGFAKEVDTTKAEDLLAKTKGFINSTLEVPLIAAFNVTEPVARDYPIPFEPGIETSMEAVYKDDEGKRIRTIDVGEPEMNVTLRKSFIYDNLNDESKKKLDVWVEDEFDDGNSIITEYTHLLDKTYEPILPGTAEEAKTEADDHIFDELKAVSYNLKPGLIPSITVEWDGKDDNGQTLPAGGYRYYPAYIDRETKPGGATKHCPMPKKMGMVVTAAKVEHGKMVFFIQDPLGLEKGREIEFTGKEVIVG